MYHTPDEIAHPRFLESPLNTLRASLDPSKLAISHTDILSAYDTLHHRLSNLLHYHEQADPPVDLGALPSSIALKRRGEALVRVIARDTYNITVDQYAHTTHHPEEDHSLDIDQYGVDPDYDDFAFRLETGRVELLCSICISALKIVGLILMSDALIALFSSNQLTILLESTLLILNAPEIFVPRKNRIVLLAMWTLSKQRLPRDVGTASMSQIARCLSFSCGQEGRTLSAHLQADAFAAATNFIGTHPDGFLLPAASEILSAALSTALTGKKIHRKGALRTIQATCSAILGLRHDQRGPVEQIASQVTHDFLSAQQELAAGPKDTSILAYLKHSLTQPDISDTIHLISLLSCASILSGHSLFAHPKQSRFVTNCIWEGFASKSTTVRTFSGWAWRCLIWTAANENVQDRLATVPDLALHRLDHGMGVALIAAMQYTESYRFWELLRVLKFMLTSERDEVRRDGSEIVLHLLLPPHPGEVKDDIQTEQSAVYWKKVIPPLLFQTSSLGATKEEAASAMREAQKKLITSADIASLSDMTLQSYWAELLQLFHLSLHHRPILLPADLEQLSLVWDRLLSQAQLLPDPDSYTKSLQSCFVTLSWRSLKTASEDLRGKDLFITSLSQSLYSTLSNDHLILSWAAHQVLHALAECGLRGSRREWVVLFANMKIICWRLCHPRF